MGWIEDIRKRASSAEAPLMSTRKTSKADKLSLNELVFVPAQLAKTPHDYYREKIDSETIIGKSSRHPLKLKIPIMIAAMSFGAMSKEAKIALARASSIVGTCANTGEGGMLPEERKEAEILIAQYSTARFGVDEKYLKSADAIEMKIGQGAKPGMGGLLPKEKLTEEIVKLRHIKFGEDVHSPPKHPDINSIGDLRKKIQWLKKITNGKPVILKLGAGDVAADVKLAVKANPDVIAVDSMMGATGAAPEVMLEEFGSPLLTTVVEARKTLDKLKAKQDLVVGGGLNTGGDMAKCLALGADAVFVAFPLMIAMGCTNCRLCYKDVCPVGIATQKPELRKKFMQGAEEKISNYLKSCTEEIKICAAACGRKGAHELRREDVRSLSWEVSQMTGIKMV
ncbi:MAG: FMN-binding glutamate synthase family protein [Candidatus Diapherotrites archaeon]|nr:FMN-binding glutamate synthase family protein [Candidatus Diapherotrites archaeon]